MRFQIRELLALPLLFVAISVVADFIGQPDFLYATRTNWVIDELEELVAIANDPTKLGVISSAQEMNDMITDPTSEFDVLFGQHLRSDHWGTPFVCVEIEEQLGDRWQFYSNGLDRQSQTNGHDPDDLNSWGLSNQHYVILSQ